MIKLDYLHRCWIAICFLVSISDAQTPSIKREPDDVTVVQGKDVILYCTVENLAIGSKIQWTKGDFGLGFDKQLSDFPRYSVIGDESLGEYNLLIKNTTIADEDDYECQVTSYRMRTKTARVTVQVLPEGPAIDDAVYDTITVRANAANLITCRSWNGKPAADLKWYKGGVLLNKNVTYAVTDQSYKLHNVSATLRIWPGIEDDGERYYCVMSSNVGVDEGKLAITRNVPVELDVQKPPVANIIFEPANLMEGSSVSVLCDSSASKPPATSYIWHLNKDIISGQSSPRIRFDDLSKSMNGAKIGCQAVNHIDLPKLLTAPEDISVNVGENATFYCEWDSNPVSQITWYRSGIKGQNDAILGVGNTLTMNSVQQSDAGQILCVADVPGVGRNEAKTKLVVWGKPIISSDEEQFVKLGEESAVVECRISSDPGIQHVTWYWERNGITYLITNNNTIMSNSNKKEKGSPQEKKVMYEGRFQPGDDAAELVIYDVTKSNLISYNCTVTNSYGEDTQIIALEELIVPVQHDSLGPIVGGTIAGVLLIVIIVVLCICCNKNYQHKSTILNHYSSKSGQKSAPHNGSVTSPGHKKDRKLSGLDPDSDNPSTSSSVSCSGGVHDQDVLMEMNEIKVPVQNDDGYHTEEASSWNRAENGSPLPPANNYSAEQGIPLLPTSSPNNAPSYIRQTESPLNSDLSGLRSDIVGFSQPQPPLYEEDSTNGVDLPRLQDYPTANMYVTNSYSSLRRNGGYPPSYTANYPYPNYGGSNTPSAVSSHRSVDPTPYVTQHYMINKVQTTVPHAPLQMDENFPTQQSVDGEFVFGPTSSVSSLEKVPYFPDPALEAYENSSKVSHVSSRLSHASKSSDMFQRPKTARMATHV